MRTLALLQTGIAARGFRNQNITKTFQAVNIAFDEISFNSDWIGQEEVWKKLVCQNPKIGHSRLLPILKSKSFPIYENHEQNVVKSFDQQESTQDCFHTCQKFEELKLESEEIQIELRTLKLKLKDKEVQLKAANEFVETLTIEREEERLEIIKLNKEIKDVRLSREFDKTIIEELHNQVNITQCGNFWIFLPF